MADVKSKMPSVIVSIDVAVGDAVERGTKLAVCEAMKMKNDVPSPAAGTVKSIEVKEGDRVKAGGLIMVIEE